MTQARFLPVFSTPARFSDTREIARDTASSPRVGAELLGSSDLRADAEILSLSCTGLSSLGLTDLSLELGNLGVPYQLLGSLGLSDRAMMFILGSLKELKGGTGGSRQSTEEG